MNEDPTPGWYADPTRRFDHRYWDGQRWTDHVSRGGHATTDPLEGSPTATTAASERSTAATWEHAASTGARTNTKAILSLVLSIVWFGGLASLAAIVLGVMARGEIRDRPDETGQGIATAGIVIGVIGIVGMLLMVLAMVAFFGIGADPMRFGTF